MICYSNYRKQRQAVRALRETLKYCMVIENIQQDFVTTEQKMIMLQWSLKSRVKNKCWYCEHSYLKIQQKQTRKNRGITREDYVFSFYIFFKKVNGIMLLL